MIKEGVGRVAPARVNLTLTYAQLESTLKEAKRRALRGGR